MYVLTDPLWKTRAHLVGNAAVLADVKSGKITAEDIVGSVIAVSKVAEEQMGGTSGAIYSYVLPKPWPVLAC